MPPTSAVLPPRHSEPHSVGYVLGVIMLVASMLGLAAAYGVSHMLRDLPIVAPPTFSGPMVTTKLVGKTLTIPASWLRDDAQRRGDFVSQIDLELHLPLGPNGALKAINVTLLPQSQARSSASLLDGVYLHQFMPNQLSGPPGLVGKPLYASDGYENESVWYDALSPNPFVAKCSTPPDHEHAGRCLRTVALSDGIAALYTFDTDVLGAWKQFDPDMAIWLKRIGAL